MMKFISREFAEAVRRAFMSSFGVELPDTETLLAEETDVLMAARVILYNDEIHTFDEVIFQLMKATGCSISEGEQIALEVDSTGLACVFEGEVADCLRVSGILEEIALHTEVRF
ncbi:MAG: ATP-dependent Clp protease adaptor protein ClpS [Chlorobi bacterium]|nr:ATP-dependent Clp protease adaptor protein ClpS [Chlorobiota bacterium]